MSFSSVLKWLSLHLCLRSKPDSLISISSVVHFKEEMDNLDKKNSNYEKSSIDEDTSEEDSDSETDEEEYECVACKQFFLGEDRMEQHRSIYLHWGYAKYINSKIKMNVSFYNPTRRISKFPCNSIEQVFPKIIQL